MKPTNHSVFQGPSTSVHCIASQQQQYSLVDSSLIFKDSEQSCSRIHGKPLEVNEVASLWQAGIESYIVDATNAL